ncbi:MAG: hypothetical protein ACYCUG_11285 [Acidimicrobiales bacterium]
MADEEDEDGYDLDGWSGPARGRLIIALIEAGIEHRFEDEELIVAVDDEERTDDLVAAIVAGAPAEGADVPGDEGDEEPVADDALLAEVELLRSAAQRLSEDPTDMQADGDVAQASAAVFAADDSFATDPDTWAAVGRVTRRLLAALGAEEALEDEIRVQAAILANLLDPVAGDELAGSDGAAEEDSVYELPEWLPEQRAQLSLLFEQEGIAHRWEKGDLVVPAATEAAVEALFDRVEGVPTDEDDEARYRALEELFAAADRFVNDPNNKSRAAEVVRAVTEADGPTPVGLDDAQWWTIRTRARTLADALEHGGNPEVAFGEATTLRDLLRALV